MGDLRKHRDKAVYEHSSYGYVEVTFDEVKEINLIEERNRGKLQLLRNGELQYNLVHQDGNWEIVDKAGDKMLTIQIPDEDAKKIWRMAEK